MKRYRYFAYHIKDEDGFHGWQLLTDAQITVIINDLMKTPTRQDIFTTIQDYNKEGDVISCPIYVDFDDNNSIKDARTFVKKFEKLTGVYPAIFFSGSRGIHLVAPFIIEHPKCHLVVQYIVRSLLDVVSIDHQVYTNKRLWRVPHTYHTSSECYKTHISVEELMNLDLDEMKELYKRKPKYPYVEASDSEMLIKQESVNLVIDEAKAYIDTQVKNNVVKESAIVGDWSVNMFPCVRHILENCPEDGNMNTSVCILARFFRQHGVACEDACNIIMEQSHYKMRQQKEKDVLKVIRSTYKSNVNGRIGCKYNGEGALLRKFCNDLCCYKMNDWYFDDNK
jgi:hypothetical protein